MTIRRNPLEDRSHRQFGKWYLEINAESNQLDQVHSVIILANSFESGSLLVL